LSASAAEPAAVESTVGLEPVVEVEESEKRILEKL
jgi:hypothetical protein